MNRTVTRELWTLLACADNDFDNSSNSSNSQSSDSSDSDDESISDLAAVELCHILNNRPVFPNTYRNFESIDAASCMRLFSFHKRHLAGLEGGTPFALRYHL